MFNRKRTSRQQSKPSGRKLQFESLETRALLTGTVTTSLAGGRLSLTGDSNANSVTLSESNGTWTVQGVGTKISGKTTFTGVTSIFTQLLTGDDTVKIQNGTLTGTLEVLYGSSNFGNKNTQITNVSAGNVLLENDSSGTNFISLQRITTTTAGMTINTGAGNDSIMLGIASLKTNLSINAGNGANAIAVNSVQTLGTLANLIQTGTGGDAIGITSFTSASNLTVNSGAGSDSVAINSVNVGAKTLTVDVGPGNSDNLGVVGSTAGTAKFLDTGGAGGYISGLGNSFTSLFVDSNFTNDTLS